MLSSAQTKRLGRRLREGGFTLLDALVACGIMAFSLAAVTSTHGWCLKTLRATHDESAASQVLQQRVEQLRIANWQRVTSPTWIRDNILNVAADGAYMLPNLSEAIKIEAINSSATTPPVNKFTRANYLAAADPANVSTMVFENTAKITWTISWNGVPIEKTRTREMVFILAKGGVAK
jgi:type II secretory pathway pseudopilin PulG